MMMRKLSERSLTTAQQSCHFVDDMSKQSSKNRK